MVVCANASARESSVLYRDREDVIVYVFSWSGEGGERKSSNGGGKAAHCSIVCPCNAML